MQDNNEQNIPQPTDVNDQLKRALADYANLKRRFEKEREEITRFSNEVLLMQLVNTVDGLELTLQGFNNLLERNGFTKLPIEVGEKYNPETMEALETADGGEFVTEVYAPAYKLHDRIVRPAKVKVGKEVSHE